MSSKIEYHENGKLKSVELDYKVVLALLAPFTVFFKLVVKWIIIFTIALKGLLAAPAHFIGFLFCGRRVD